MSAFHEDSFEDLDERFGPADPGHAAGYYDDRLRRRRLGLMSSAALMQKELPPVKDIVPGVIPEGLTIFAGKSKIGKSWLMKGVCIAVSMGGYALGSIKCEQGDVLYLALEDNERRLQTRLSQLLPIGAPPERLFIDTAAPRLDSGLLADLRDWLETANNPRLIVVDVLNRVRPPQKPNEGVYDYDVRCLIGLQALASEFGIAIVVVHHTRKAEAEDPFDCLSGSTGLPGTADTTLVLARDSQGTTLYGRGRDLDEFEKAMTFDKTTGFWTMQGDADETRRSGERNTIRRALLDGKGSMSPSEISAATGMKGENVRFLLFKMVAAGEAIKAERGRYLHPDLLPPANKANNANNYRSSRDGDDDDC
jgi:hypothetical protein